jgi:hypothetical protein
MVGKLTRSGQRGLLDNDPVLVLICNVLRAPGCSVCNAKFLYNNVQGEQHGFSEASAGMALQEHTAPH